MLPVLFVNPRGISAFTLVSMCATTAWGQHLRKPGPTNLLVNSGFETGDFTGWTVTGDSPNYGVNIAGFLMTGGRFDGTGWYSTRTAIFMALRLVGGHLYTVLSSRSRRSCRTEIPHCWTIRRDHNPKTSNASDRVEFLTQARRLRR